MGNSRLINRLFTRTQESIKRRREGAKDVTEYEEEHEFYELSVGILTRPVYCQVCQQLMTVLNISPYVFLLILLYEHWNCTIMYLTQGTRSRAISCGVCFYTVHENCVKRGLLDISTSSAFAFCSDHMRYSSDSLGSTFAGTLTQRKPLNANNIESRGSGVSAFLNHRKRYDVADDCAS